MMHSSRFSLADTADICAEYKEGEYGCQDTRGIISRAAEKYIYR